MCLEGSKWQVSPPAHVSLEKGLKKLLKSVYISGTLTSLKDEDTHLIYDQDKQSKKARKAYEDLKYAIYYPLMRVP